jgi:hypothetical protein
MSPQTVHCEATGKYIILPVDTETSRGMSMAERQAWYAEIRAWYGNCGGGPGKLGEGGH